MRTSSYTIYVDLPDTSEEMLLVHGYSGAYDKVSRKVATYLRSLEVRRAPQPLYGAWESEPLAEAETVDAPQDQTIKTLKRRGYLTEMTVDEEEDFLVKMASKTHQSKLMSMPSYVIMPTYDCNLRCAYCFQDHMRTNAKYNHLLRTIQPAMVDRILGAMPQIEARHGITPDQTPTRSILFFGGEPLLEANLPTIQYIIDKALDMGPTEFLAISNATELSTYGDLISPQRISNIQVTLDGPPEEHDRRRIYADGSGSWEKIRKNVTWALNKGVSISVRLNIDRNNIDTMPAVAEAIHNEGWHEFPHFTAYTAPIHPSTDKISIKTTMNTYELDQALAEMREENPLIEVLGRPDDSIRNQAHRLFLEGSNSDGMPPARESYCSAHVGMYIFDAFGDIYACWERTGNPNIRLGNISPDGTVSIKNDNEKLWRSRTVASNPACRKCRYNMHCGGGCAVLAEGKTGNIHMNYCDAFASRFRASVAEAYHSYLTGEDLKLQADRVCDQ